MIEFGEFCVAIETKARQDHPCESMPIEDAGMVALGRTQNTVKLCKYNPRAL